MSRGIETEGLLRFGCSRQARTGPANGGLDSRVVESLGRVVHDDPCRDERVSAKAIPEPGDHLLVGTDTHEEVG